MTIRYFECVGYFRDPRLVSDAVAALADADYEFIPCHELVDVDSSFVYGTITGYIDAGDDAWGDVHGIIKPFGGVADSYCFPPAPLSDAERIAAI
jgi:hypothetical protein